VVTPKQQYEAKLAQGDFQIDTAQAEVIERLDDLYARLQARALQARGWQGVGAWIARLRGGGAPKRVTGLYIWGGVGRGKTMLMDLFFEALSGRHTQALNDASSHPDSPVQVRALRMHFHRFMRRVHKDLATHGGTADPLLAVADGFAAETEVLCFDEFFVSDIGDAMILGELMTALFERGVTLVATSNVEPSKLYENGLQRRRFLPAIDQLYANVDVLHVADGVDFRLRALQQAEIYHYPLDDAAEAGLQRSLQALAPHPPETNVSLQVENREIHARYVADDVAWFDFAALCEGPRSQNDYIELAMEYHAVLLSDVPVLTTKKEDAARRFISLVDEFYDHGVKLIISAAAPIMELYQGERLRFEFERTASRLLEMQSHDYLAASHIASHTPSAEAPEPSAETPDVLAR